MTDIKKKMRPVLDGDFWLIGDNPDLGDLNGDKTLEVGKAQECVDHHVFQADDGKWHLWGCVRGTKIGRLLYHWKANNLTDTHWEQTGEMLHPDQSVGENMCRFYDQDWIQSPYIIKENGKYYMFYGGHSTEWDAYGRASDRFPYKSHQLNSACVRGQICLMTSEDGLNWTRHLNPEGRTRLFAGPGESRDPMLLKANNLWHMYCAGAVVALDGEIMPQIYVRTSEDLLHWSDYSVVHYDFSITNHSENERGVWTHECPFVAEHAGYYYLFRTENYEKQCTHVYRSEDPKDFGLGGEDAKAKYVGVLPVAAPEVIRDKDGQEYVTSNHNLAGGTMLCKLKWEEA